MRAIRTWGSVRGVTGDRHPYRDQRGDATRAPIQVRNGGRRKPPRPATILAESDKSREREGRALALKKAFFLTMQVRS